MDTLVGVIVWLIGVIWSTLTWVLGNLLWLIIWLVLPFAIAAFVVVRIAEKALGPEVVRTWVKAQSLKFGRGTWIVVRRWLLALSALPLRVLFWLAIYTVWHSVLSLFYRPRWHPWTRAWAKRWRPNAAAPPAKLTKGG